MKSLIWLGLTTRAEGGSVDGWSAQRVTHRILSARQLRSLLVTLSVVACAVSVEATLPRYAAAEAVPGSQSTEGPSGLPDGRAYEQVSPANKYGSEAGAPISKTAPYIVAGTGGDEAAYFNTGPLGETPAGFDFYSIARRGAGGWQSHAAVSRGEGFQGAFRTDPAGGLGFSAEMGASVFGAADVFVPEQEPSGPTPHLYRYSESGLVQWIGKPTGAAPLKFEGFDGPHTGELAGASPDMGTIYYSFEGAITAADEEPDPALGNVSRAQEIRTMNDSGTPPRSNDGFYEWHEGVLEAAGILPDGHLDPYGAVAANTPDASDYSAESLQNQVSEDGRDAFFVSPDPDSGSERPVELYLRHTAGDGTHTTVLVSRDLLLPEVGGLPAAAPSGVAASSNNEGGYSYVYASPDGSHAFFESPDQLTAGAPAGNSVKAYDFDTHTDTLTYMPGVADLPAPTAAHPLQSSHDGSTLLFVREDTLDVWSGGKVTEVASLEGGFGRVELARAAAGGIFVFQSNAPFAKFGFNNGNGEHEEIYRYDVDSNALDCVSCPPAGSSPSGNAAFSHAFQSSNLGETFIVTSGNRGVSEDGGRVFFDTPDALLAQDTNGKRDVYEWEDGALYLLSTGVSGEESFFGDNSPTGNDAFFSTAEGLVSGDSDEGFDVYDARVPRPGDQVPPSQVPCEGAVCQGPPSVPQLLSAPASESFSGTEGLAPVPPGHPTSKSLTRKQRLATALKACKRRKNKHKRAACEKQARRAYGAKSAAVQGHSTADRRHNGRGK